MTSVVETGQARDSGMDGLLDCDWTDGSSGTTFVVVSGQAESSETASKAMREQARDLRIAYLAVIGQTERWGLSRLWSGLMDCKSKRRQQLDTNISSVSSKVEASLGNAYESPL